MAEISAEGLESKMMPTTADRVVNAVKRTAHASHEARLFKSLAQDAIEGGIHDAKRGIRRRIRQCEDMRDEAALRIRRRPLQSVGGVFGVGLALGIAAGWIIGRKR